MDDFTSNEFFKLYENNNPSGLDGVWNIESLNIYYVELALSWLHESIFIFISI